MSAQLDHTSGAMGHLCVGGVDTQKVISGKYTFPTSYTTGGVDMEIGKNFRKINRIIIGSFPVTATVAAATADPVTGKIKAFVAAGTEVANATNLSTVTVEFIAIGLP
jgi:hypothetical protein